MKQFLRAAAVLLLAATLTTACGSDDDGPNGEDLITEQSFNNFFSYVVDKNTKAGEYFTGQGYKVRLNYSRGTAEVLIAQLRLPGNMSYPNLSLKDLRFTSDKDGWLHVEGNNLRPTSTTGISLPIIEEFELDILPRSFEEGYLPQVCIEMEVENHDIVSSYSTMFLFGKSTTTSPDGKVSEIKDLQYRIGLDTEKSSLQISMANAQFIPSMPSLNIDMLDVPYHFDGDDIVFSLSKLIPSIGGTPFPGFPMTDITGRIDFTEGLKLTFDCNPEKLPGLHHVVIEADYFPSADSE